MFGDKDVSEKGTEIAGKVMSDCLPSTTIEVAE